MGPLDEDTARGLLEGRIHIYVYGWAKWNDPDGNVGIWEQCQWLQPPRERELTAHIRCLELEFFSALPLSLQTVGKGVFTPISYGVAQ
jgi:hypothetical protein